MSSIQPKGGVRSHEKPVPGCLGRVTNLFDVNVVSRNRLLTDKPRCDVSSLSRSRSDVSRMKNSIVGEMEDKMMDSNMRSSSPKKLEGTSMKMLMAQEMSSLELESKHSSSNVVAKLMGLDALPQEHHSPGFGHGRRISQRHAKNNHPMLYSQEKLERPSTRGSEIPVGYWKQEEDFIHEGTNCEDRHFQEQHNYKDIYETWQPPFQTRNKKSVPPRKGRRSGDTNEENMALFRQKLMDAKRLSTDEKLRQTKEFQDAVELLSSNQDLFLKVLSEPFSGHISGQQQSSPPSETKRITVLKPSKSGSGSEKQFRKLPSREQGNGKDNEHHYRVSPSVATWKAEECHTQPTRIVVLKPSPGMIQDVKELVSATPTKNLRQANFIEKSEDNETQEAREATREITQMIHENLASHQRDETLFSPLLYTGYTCDESSFNKSVDDLLVSNNSDTDVMSPASRHSWEYVNQYSSPYSCSSFSRGSYSPESSVCREAKKRLSERWSTVASNSTVGEQRHLRRSSSTLGDMLALSEINKSELVELQYSERDQESRAPTQCMTGNARADIESPRSFTRSKSLPVSAATSGQRLNAESLAQEIRKSYGLKETLKQMTKSSFRGKVASLFFSRIMKSTTKRINKSPNHDKARLDSMETSTSPAPFDHNSKGSISKENHSPNEFGQGASSTQGAPSVSNSASALKLSYSKDRPSPMLVREPTLEDYDKSIMGLSSSITPNELGKHFSLGKSNLIDKSPPIGSVPRILLCEDPCTTTTISKPLKYSILISKGGAKEDEEWRFLVQSLLSAASLENVSELKWHSSESPLDPSLRDKDKWSHLRSIHMQLVFDCVNEALVDITRPGLKVCHTGVMLGERVWTRIKEWLPACSQEGDGSWVLWEEDDGDENCLLAERVVRKEVMGRGWDDERKLMVELLLKEFEMELLDDMVGDILLTTEIL